MPARYGTMIIADENEKDMNISPLRKKANIFTL